MKSVISALVIFIIIITILVVSCAYTENIVNEMLHYVYENEIFFAKNDWMKSSDKISKIDTVWKNARNVMVILFNHTVIEKIDTSISKLNNAVKLQKNEDFLYESENLKLLLKNLIEQQKISVGNVL